jgi:molecular chaperone DnaK
VQELRSALQGTDVDAIRRGMSALSESMQKIGAAMYSAQGAAAGAGGQGGGQRPPDEGTVEGEFREV